MVANVPAPALKTYFPVASVLLWLSFFVLAFYLYLMPATALFLFPLFIPISLLIFLAHQLAEPALSGKAWLPFLPLFVSALVPALLWTRLQKMEGFILVCAWLFLAALFKTAQAFFLEARKKISGSQEQIKEIDKYIKSVAQENGFYSERIRALKSQIGFRQKLSSFAREMGILLNPEEIKQKLIEKVQTLFPGEKTSLKTSPFNSEPVDSWINEHKSSVLIKELSKDNRFALSGVQTGRSVIAAPLLLEKNIMGVIRIDSESSGRFSETDLRQLELYVHLCVLALENARLFSKVNAMATKDPLTGLATHRIFQEKLTEEILRAARYGTPLSILMLDIDHFKSVNDRYGHLAGDRVLQEVGQVLASACRPSDFACRYGGEEFSLIFPQLTAEQVFKNAENLREKIARHRIAAAHQTLNITVSIGCASFPRDAQTSSQLIRKADERLYKAKTQGRNRVVIE